MSPFELVETEFQFNVGKVNWFSYMEQLLEILIILGAVAIAIAFLARRFLFKGKQGNCSGTCKCAKPDLPKLPR